MSTMETTKQLRARLKRYKKQSRDKWWEIAESSGLTLSWLQNFLHDRHSDYKSAYEKRLSTFLNKKERFLLSICKKKSEKSEK